MFTLKYRDFYAKIIIVAKFECYRGACQVTGGGRLAQLLAPKFRDNHEKWALS
jgi:hypothetical protein